MTSKLRKIITFAKDRAGRKSARSSSANTLPAMAELTAISNAMCEAAKRQMQDALHTDACPKCGQIVTISKAQGTMNLKRKRADGQPCRYKAIVVEWKIKR